MSYVCRGEEDGNKDKLTQCSQVLHTILQLGYIIVVFIISREKYKEYNRGHGMVCNYEYINYNRTGIPILLITVYSLPGHALAKE